MVNLLLPHYRHLLSHSNISNEVAEISVGQFGDIPLGQVGLYCFGIKFISAKLSPSLGCGIAVLLNITPTIWIGTAAWMDMFARNDEFLISSFTIQKS
ncbi:MAG: hypothetical protein CM15mP62_20570 [Rhodospirillaceae bacterium]|nr:MAG: hypothetical protein CM15mP62_20570 [Rhodospirillaceae bacterium]